MMSVGVKVTLCEAVPTFGAVDGVVKAKLPGTDPTPPLKVELVKVCPYVMALATGRVVIVGVTLVGVISRATLSSMTSEPPKPEKARVLDPALRFNESDLAVHVAPPVPV